MHAEPCGMSRGRCIGQLRVRGTQRQVVLLHPADILRRGSRPDGDGVMLVVQERPRPDFAWHPILDLDLQQHTHQRARSACVHAGAVSDHRCEEQVVPSLTGSRSSI
eukprot:6188087-Pleurochrysis_carterae.AAC.5